MCLNQSFTLDDALALVVRHEVRVADQVHIETLHAHGLNRLRRVHDVLPVGDGDVREVRL
jgi:hypothetical protein